MLGALELLAAHQKSRGTRGEAAPFPSHAEPAVRRNPSGSDASAGAAIPGLVAMAVVLLSAASLPLGHTL
jgi:hypothetical protein